MSVKRTNQAQKKQWWIIGRDGQPRHDLVITRPKHANSLVDGSPFTPWFQSKPHFHIEEGVLVHGHLFGTLEAVAAEMMLALKSEKDIIKMADGQRDVFLDTFFHTMSDP